MSWFGQRLRSFGNAFRGIAVLMGEAHAKIHALATLLVLVAGWWLEVSRADWVSLLLAISLVWLAEGLNTALEHLADAAVPEQHPLVGKAKDVAAGSVLICAVGAAAVAALVFPAYL